MDWIGLVGYAAAALVLASFFMRTMLPLRLAAIGGNLLFILFGLFAGLPQVLLLHVILLPLNIWRCWEMVQLGWRVRAAARGDLSLGWLLPYMRRMRLADGAYLFRRGDTATRLYVLDRGTLWLEEARKALGPGQVIGEMGLFSAARERTQSARARGPAELFWIGEEDLARLCYQNPAIAFHLLRLITNRMLENARAAGPAQ